MVCWIRTNVSFRYQDHNLASSASRRIPPCKYNSLKQLQNLIILKIPHLCFCNFPMYFLLPQDSPIHLTFLRIFSLFFWELGRIRTLISTSSQPGQFNHYLTNSMLKISIINDRSTVSLSVLISFSI